MKQNIEYNKIFYNYKCISGSVNRQLIIRVYTDIVQLHFNNALGFSKLSV